jgi:hypothetical protein
MKTDKWFKYHKIKEAITLLTVVRDEEMIPLEGSLVRRSAMEDIISRLTFYQLSSEPFEL